MKQTQSFNKKTSSLCHQTIVLTGATGGLGSAVSRDLLALSAKLILVNRSRQKTARLVQDLRSSFPDAQVECFYADFNDIHSVTEVCRQLQTKPIDYLIHNAGAYDISRKVGKSGFDPVFQINFVSPYCMTKQLLPTLKSRHAKVITVGSIAHNFVKMNPKDLDFQNQKMASLVYGNSKRFLMYSMLELIRQTPEIQLSIVHPGISYTNIMSHYPKVISALIKWPMKVIFMSPEKAAGCILTGMFEDVPDGCWAGPGVFHIWGKSVVERLPSCSCEERKAIFAQAERIAGEMISEESAAESSFADDRAKPT